MPAKKSNVRVTQQELQRAIAKYLRAGGRIQKLPDQKAALRSRVGDRWDSSEIGPDPAG